EGTHGAGVAQDNRFSVSTIATCTAAVSTLWITVSDNVPPTSASTIVLAIQTAITAIHDIQGPGPTSPLVDKYVTTKGIVTAIKFNGVFIQLRDVETDADDRTSEGLFVFTGVSPPAFLATGP